MKPEAEASGYPICGVTKLKEMVVEVAE